MGMFDDLVAEQQPPNSGGMFDDLQPEPTEEEQRAVLAKRFQQRVAEADSEIIQDLRARQQKAWTQNDKESLEKEIVSRQVAIAKRDMLRESNPHLAEIIESMPDWEKSAVNFGRGLHDISRGFGFEDAEKDTGSLDALQDQSPAGEGARMLGQTAPFAPLAAAGAYAAPLLGLGGTVPTTIGASALAGTEGYTSQTGMGEDPTLATAVGVLAPPLAVAAPKIVGGIVDAFSKRKAKSEDVRKILGAAQPDDTVDEIERIAKAGAEDSEGQIKQLLIASDNNAHPTLKEVAKTVSEGGTASDVAEVISTQKLKGTEGAAAKFRLEGGKVKSSTTGKSMIALGMPSNDVQLVVSKAPANKEAFNKIIDYAERGIKSSSAKNKFHPQSVVGNSLKKRLDFVSGKNKEAGKQIERVARKLKSEPIDLSEPFGKFISKMKDSGVKFKKGSVDFEGSAFMDLPDIQRSIKNVVNRLNPARNKTVSAYDAHILKKYFDEQINYGKTPTAGMSAKVEGAIKDFRRDVNKVLGDISPEYRAVNTQYADTIGAINDLKNLAGRQKNLAGDHVEETLGMLSKRVTSNAMSRGAVKDAIKSLEDVSAKYGKNFGDSIDDQVQFVNAMEKSLGAFADTSLLGQASTAQKLAAKRGRTMIDAGVEGIDYISKKINPKSEAAYIAALKKLVNEQ